METIPMKGANVCSYTTDYSQTQWWTVMASGEHYKLVSGGNADASPLYVLDRSRYKNSYNNADVWTNSSADDGDQLFMFEEIGGPTDTYYIKLAKPIVDPNSKVVVSYLTAIDSENGNTGFMTGNVQFTADATARSVWKARLLFETKPSVSNIEVQETQVWLNETFHLGLTVNGITGTTVMTALVKALQMSLGIENVTGIFGNETLSKCPTLINSDSATENIRRILQGGLVCKGYPCGTYGSYDSKTQQSIKEVYQDAGIVSANDTYATPRIFQAVLKSDSLKLLTGGDSRIRDIQRAFNSEFYEEWGIIPCDGIYGRELNRALIYMLQRYEGMPSDVASGSFYSQTKLHCPDIPYTGQQLKYSATVEGGTEQYSNSEITKFTKLLQYSLYCNRFKDLQFSGSYDSQTSAEVKNCAEAYVLSATFANIDIWMALLTSRGNPQRSCTACDAATQLHENQVNALTSRGYKTIGRYLTGTVGGNRNKYLTPSEIMDILSGGMAFFPIYQASNPAMEDYINTYFTAEQGRNDARAALEAATDLGLPSTIIYFAVDCDVLASQVPTRIAVYFSGINEILTGTNYKVGIYGTRYVCQTIMDTGMAVDAFISDMSTGYAGNLGYPLPTKWAYDQFYWEEITVEGGESFDIDKVVKNPQAETVSSVPMGTALLGTKALAYVNESGFVINMSDKAIPVYRKLKEFKDFSELEIEGYIQPGDYYAVHKDIIREVQNGYLSDYGGAPFSDYRPEVFFRKQSGRMGFGIVDGRTLFDENGSPIGFAAGRENQEYFTRYNSDGEKLIPNTPIAIDDSGDKFYVFTAQRETQIYDDKGLFLYNIPKGTQVATNYNTAGKTHCNWMYVEKIKLATGWTDTPCFIDMKMAEGVSPKDRLLW